MRTPLARMLARVIGGPGLRAWSLMRCAASASRHDPQLFGQASPIVFVTFVGVFVGAGLLVLRMGSSQ